MSYRAQLSKSIRELRFVMCQQSPASAGARQFIKQNYSDLKQLNPNFPLIVRECQGAQPNVMARYDFGVERRVYLNGLTEAEVDKAVGELVDQAAEVNSRL
mmetsp:Transcript_12698/g.21383  ORF Transcript_12698/g.21383 Transcript_12698/m.21383 type:complete len:101 (-) Transcript_12698:78-380(-)